MPSKAELKKEVDELRASLKDTTKRLTEIKLSDKMIEIPLDKEGKAIPRESSNPHCFSALQTIESDIATGKSYWDIANEQYERWQKGADSCLPCEREYVEAKESLMEVGERYRNLASPESLKIEDVAVEVREQAMRELGKAKAHIKTMAGSCRVKMPKVISRLDSMRVLAHVGRWEEFMNNQKQLLSDFELDVKETIPDISVKMPSYAVPPAKKFEAEIRLKPESELTPEERKFRDELRARIGR